MAEPLPASKIVAQRLHAFRTTRRMTVEQMAEHITKAGYPITRSVLSNVENFRFKTLPVDFLVAARLALGLDHYDFHFGPLCDACMDNPPKHFICTVCGRTKNADGELVRC